MNAPHIIGGVQMILHEGEVYARLIDIIAASANDNQIKGTFAEEERQRPAALPATIAEPRSRAGRKPKVDGSKSPKVGRMCGNCGEIGHSRRTCGDRPATDPTEPMKSMSLKQIVQEAIDAGDGFEEICMSYPSIPSAAISKVYKELTAESDD